MLKLRAPGPRSTSYQSRLVRLALVENRGYLKVLPTVALGTFRMPIVGASSTARMELLAPDGLDAEQAVVELVRLRDEVSFALDSHAGMDAFSVARACGAHVGL